MTSGEDELPRAVEQPRAPEELLEAPEQPPRAEAGRFRPLAPEHVLVEKLVARITALVLTLGAAVGLAITWLASDLPRGGLLALAIGASIFVIALWVFAAKWPPLEYRHTGYRVDADSIVFKRGVYWRSVASVPRARIQHTDVAQGPLQRNYGLATLVIYTAGTSYSRLALAGLPHAEAQRIRDELLEPGGLHGS